MSRKSKQPDERDFVAIADAYARDAIADTGNERHCHWIRLAASRYVRDRKRATEKGAPFKFSREQAQRPCEFIEQLPHVEGKWDTATIVLHASHIFFVVNLFGFRGPDGTRRFTVALLAVARKNAKALALDTPIPTPTGWTTMGEIRIGDAVFGTDGTPRKVLATSDVFTDQDCYRLTFSNDEQVIAGASHEWLTSAHVDQPGGHRVGNRATRTRVRTTQEIAESLHHGARGDLNHSISMPEPIQCAAAELPVPPYTLGAWLGDGHSASARITFMPSDTEIADGIRADGIPLRDMGYCRGKATTYALSDGDRRQSARDVCLATRLRNLGVMPSKHIPEIYLRAAFGQRLALLQGLMDTDGTVSKSGRVLSFTNTTEALARGVGDLLSTLGVKYSIKARPMRCNGAPVSGNAWLVQFVAFRDDLPVFRLERKLSRMRTRATCRIAPRCRSVQVVAAESVPMVPVKCITVDSPDHQFLFGRTMLPTHNSTLAAAILLYCLCYEEEPGPQVITAATTGDQARIIFNIAKRMVEQTPDLREAFNLEVFANAVTNWQVGGNLKPINAHASTQDGLNPSHVALDEIHAHKNHDLLNVLQSAAGARLNALWLYTTTEGYETPGPWPETRKFAQQILSGLIEAEHFFALMYQLDDQIGEPGQPGYRKADDDFDESKWAKANPLMDVNPILEREIRKAAIEAKQMPGRHAEFKIKRLNRQAAAANTWLNIERWKRCNGEVDLNFLEGKDCWAALDGAATTDLMAFRLVWRIEDIVYTWGRRWVPTDAVAQRTERGTVPYAGWIAAGLITQLPGNIIDYAFVERDILELSRRFKPKVIAYDSWNIRDLVTRLTAHLPQRQMPDGKQKSILEEFRQGPRSFNPAMKETERLYLAGNMRHGGDAVLNWCASNVVPRYDENMNAAPDRKKSADKIDDAVALFMAIGVMGVPAAPEKKFQLMFV